MSNIFVNIPVPAANGSGAPVSTSALGYSKTISVTGPFVAAVTIEISNELAPTKWAPLVTFNNPDGAVFNVACRWMRATVGGYKSGAPSCDIGSTDDGALFATLPVPAGNGAGAAVDVSALGLFKTVTVGGGFTGSLQIEVSEDGVSDWSQLAFGFGNPGYQTEVMAAKWMRVTRSGVVAPAGTPIVNVGACLYATGGGGGGGGSTIIVEDEGTAIPGNPFTTLDFVGPGVEATDGGGGTANIEIIDAVIFDDAVPADRVNIRSDRALYQSPINNTAVGITNLSSNSSGSASGATSNYTTIGGGDDNSATQPYSTVMGGALNTASGYSSVAAGYRCVASGASAVALGESLTASGDGSTALGVQNTSSGKNSFVANSQNTASGDDAAALGSSTQATGDSSLAAGDGAISGGFASIAVGSGPVTSADYAFATNYETKVTAARGAALNDQAEANAYAALAVNEVTKAAGRGSLTAGYKSETTTGGKYGEAHGVFAVSSRESQITAASGKFFAAGDAQTSQLVMRGVGAGEGPPFTITLKYGDGAGTSAIALDNKRSYGIRIHAICAAGAGGVAPTGDVAYIVKDLVCVCFGGIATIIASGTQTITGGAAAVANWTIDGTVTGLDNLLTIKFYQNADLTPAPIYVVARVEFVESLIAELAPT